MSGTIPITVTADGPVPQTPDALHTLLIAQVTATNPDYTANLPGTLIEDISSTDVGALLIMDSALVDTINSISPNTINEYMLVQLGNVYGVPLQSASYTSAQVIFTSTPGFVIPKGFTVSDGTHSYYVQDGGIVGSGGTSLPLGVIATQAGTWAVPAGSINQVTTSIPNGYTVTCINALAGIPGGDPETYADYRVRVLKAGLAASQGMLRFLKTLLMEVPGVVPRLVSVQQQPNYGWIIFCGGGDPYQVAYAIWSALFDVSSLVGATLHISAVTKANPAVVTTIEEHGYVVGSQMYVYGATGMTGINSTPGFPYIVESVVNDRSFSIDLDTTSFGTYTGNGTATPVNQNVSVAIYNYPDTYTVTYVNPPQQQVAIAVTWNTNSPNYVNPAAVAQLANTALVNYVNSIPVGQPINQFELIATFQQATASAIPTQYLTRLLFSVSIDSNIVSPQVGTGIILGAPTSYFETSPALISIVQG